MTRSASRCSVAALGTAAIAFLCWRVLLALGLEPSREAAGVVWELMLVGIPVTLGGVFYVVALHALGVEEMALLRRALLSRVLPRVAG